MQKSRKKEKMLLNVYLPLVRAYHTAVKKAYSYKFALLTGALCISTVSPSAGADVSLSNNLNIGNTRIYSRVGTGLWVGTSFATDNQAYLLKSITLSVSEPGYENDSSPFLFNTSAVLDLYTDGGGRPGAYVGALTTPSSAYKVGTLTWFATFEGNGLTLSPNTTYWEVLRTTAGSIEWGHADSLIGGNGVGFRGGYAGSYNQGSSWTVYAGQEQVSQVLVTSVPEPSTLVLGTLMLVPMGLRRLRKKT